MIIDLKGSIDLGCLFDLVLLFILRWCCCYMGGWLEWMIWLRKVLRCQWKWKQKSPGPNGFHTVHTAHMRHPLKEGSFQSRIKRFASARGLCVNKETFWRWAILEEENWKPWPSLPVLWVKVGTAADVHPWWGLLLKDLQSYRYGNWAHVAQRESRYWDKQNGDPVEQHCCSQLMWKWHALEDEFYTLHLLSGSDSTRRH